MLDGSVEASVTDPVSGQRKSITLRGGQRAEFWIYDKNKEGDKCDIIVRQYGEEEIDGFVAVELKKNSSFRSASAVAAAPVQEAVPVAAQVPDLTWFPQSQRPKND